MGIALYRPLEARTPDSIRTDLASASSWTRFISDRLSVAICLSTNFALNAVSKANAAFPYGDLARPKVVEVVSWAAGNGDRSENGDYIYGKKRLREIDKRIRYLTKRIKSAEIVDPSLQKNLTKSSPSKQFLSCRYQLLMPQSLLDPVDTRLSGWQIFSDYRQLQIAVGFNCIYDNFESL